MQFTVNEVSACSGGQHVTINVTIGGETSDFRLTRDEIINEATDDSERKLRAIHRMISAVRETTTGTPTPVQVRNALRGNTYEI